jgi:hypothetical protein
MHRHSPNDYDGSKMLPLYGSRDNTAWCSGDCRNLDDQGQSRPVSGGLLDKGFEVASNRSIFLSPRPVLCAVAKTV